MNAVFFIGNNSSGYSSIIKPVCSSLAASVHNIWTNERGPVLKAPMFKEDILDDLSCKEFKATAFAYPPRTTIQTLPDGSLKWVEFINLLSLPKKTILPLYLYPI